MYPFCLVHRLRSGYSTKDYSLTGYVWSIVNLGPEHLGHGVSLKVTVVYDSLQEPLTFTCDCKFLACTWNFLQTVPVVITNVCIMNHSLYHASTDLYLFILFLDLMKPRLIQLLWIDLVKLKKNQIVFVNYKISAH